MFFSIFSQRKSEKDTEFIIYYTSVRDYTKYKHFAAQWGEMKNPNIEAIKSFVGEQWLSGRVLDLRPRGLGFEPHRSHCVVSLSKNINPSLVLVKPRKTIPL